MIREFDFIDILAQRFGTQGSGLDRGIGDDCAHLEIPDDTIQLITADMLTHGVHFSDRFMKWEDIGYRSVAVNLSDLAASGANPDHPILLLLSMAVPPEMEKD
jgi:thiamine-monophosphate kinase